MVKREQESFTLTKHAQDRMRERFPDVTRDIAFERAGAVRIRMLYEFLWNASVENRVVNDTLFMTYLHEKYGYDKTFRFFANDDMLFIGIIAAEGNFIVTVVNRYNYSSRHLRPVEKKVQKKPNTFRGVKTMKPLPHNYKAKKREHLEADLSGGDD